MRGRDATLTVRVSEAERAAIASAACALGITPSSLLRAIAKRAARDQTNRQRDAT